MQPDAWIFDLDGTLVDTVETRIVAWLRTFEEQRIPANRVLVASLIGSDGRRLARVVAEAASHTLDHGRDEEIDRRAGEIYSELNVDPRPLPGAVELLTALDENGRLWAIATSSRREQVDASIKALARSRPPIVIDGSNVEHAKPAPDLLLAAARELGVETARCCYVGDAIWDMQAAVAAGMPAIGVVSGSATDGELAGAGALFTVKDLTELIVFLAVSIRIEAATEATAELREALAALLPQLNPSLPIPSPEHLAAVIADPAVTLLVARDGLQIVGIAAVVVYATPIWVKARIEDVVVDQAARGRGVGEALVKECIELARKRGAGIVELQSARSREAANRLYPRLGFALRDSNVYRLTLR